MSYLVLERDASTNIILRYWFKTTQAQVNAMTFSTDTVVEVIQTGGALVAWKGVGATTVTWL